MLTKEACRQKMKQARAALSDNDYAMLNAGLLTHFKQLSLAHVACMHIFLPIARQKEPNTYALMDYIKQAYPAMKLVVPRSDLKANTMTHHVLTPHLELVQNKWGILQPVETTSDIDTTLIDLVVLPLLGFDRRGNRVGYGMGYYDRFLHHCRHDVQKVGLSLFEPSVEPIEHEEHDIPLDQCVTPEKIWIFNNRFLSKNFV